MSGEPEPGLVPEHQRPRHDECESVLLTVDGEQFRVCAQAGRPGAYDFDWLSGPHEYGFGLTNSGGLALSRDELVQAIREFLAEIDPATGYLAE
ncbi:hypothetical protein [Micromonospora craniellae]|uniref:Uncharacterized protein n=1 Tax=Micromonospora craniellae TaxID=2294034 RepID=A0A372FTT8_9ACTN|nr:hypothetical protein [Micromonospora craniellae]QOC90737.1 hypothetical protein ID554_21745 [Micromonospora craniellae]RFS43929.1 hypothetical protein D0Q02_24910 [Micromonospora craniellae]